MITHLRKEHDESLARKLQNNNINDFWREVKLINSSDSPMPNNTDGVGRDDKIVELWRKLYMELREAIGQLDKHRACEDKISWQHLIYLKN